MIKNKNQHQRIPFIHRPKIFSCLDHVNTKLHDPLAATFTINRPFHVNFYTPLLEVWLTIWSSLEIDEMHKHYAIEYD